MSFINELDTKKRELNDKKAVDSRHNAVLDASGDIKEAVLNAAKAIIASNSDIKSNVTVKNLPQDLATSKDIDALRDVLIKSRTTNQIGSKNATDSLTNGLTAILNQLQSEKPDNNTDIDKSIHDLAKSIKPQSDMKVSNFSELKTSFTKLEKALKSVKVETNVDLSPIDKVTKSLDKLGKTLKAMPDSSEANKELARINDKLQELIEKPTISGGGGSHSTPYKDSSGDTAFITLESGVVPTAPKVFKKTIDTTTTASVTYIGEAELGTSNATAGWRIKKIDETGADVNITWSGVNLDSIWNNRATSVTYS